MSLVRLFCCLLLVAPALPVQAEVYRYIDKNGNQVFTDAPRDGAEKVQTKPVMTMPFPKAKPGGKAGATSAQQKKPSEVVYTVTMASPPPETVFRRGEGEVPVAASVSPSLAVGQQLEILLDGKPWEGAAIPLDDSLDRGTHTLQARVVDDKGSVLATSPVVNFHVQQTSALGPTAPKKKSKS